MNNTRPALVDRPDYDGPHWTEDNTARNPYCVIGGFVFVRLTQGRVGVCDPEDWDALRQRRWFAKKSRHKFYWYGKERDPTKRAGNKNIFAHVIVAVPEPGQVVDHINGDSLDNRRKNVRGCSNRENCINSGARRNSKTGYRGVMKVKDCNRWRARLRVRGTEYDLGLFDSPEKAAMAYDAKAIEIHGPLAGTNSVLAA